MSLRIPHIPETSGGLMASKAVVNSDMRRYAGGATWGQDRWRQRP